MMNGEMIKNKELNPFIFSETENMEESISNSVFSRDSYRLTTMGSADAPLLYGFGPLSLSFFFFFFFSFFFL